MNPIEKEVKYMNLKEKIASGVASFALIAGLVAPSAFANNADLTNRTSYSTSSNIRVNQTNNADIRNDVSISSDTGGNGVFARRGDGSITTGNSNSTVSVTTSANSNVLRINSTTTGGDVTNNNNDNNDSQNGENGGNGNGDEDNNDNEITTLRTRMNGENEVPGPGDRNGRGRAVIEINLDDDELCATLTTRRIDTPTAAHIHNGDEDESGPIVVTLPTPTDGSAEGCVDVSHSLLEDIVDNPHVYYVNVHNDEFPDGAIRGQL